MSEKEEKGKKTLVNLTQDFLEYAMRSGGEDIDLGQAGEDLGASKRRLYDVTNVLAGIGVIERCGKSKVRWIGENTKMESGTQIADLMAQETEIDRMTTFVDNTLKELSNSEDFRSFGWVTSDDVGRIVNGEDISLFALRGPNDLSIELPDDDDPNRSRHRLICTSQTGFVDLIQISQPRMGL